MYGLVWAISNIKIMLPQFSFIETGWVQLKQGSIAARPKFNSTEKSIYDLF